MVLSETWFMEGYIDFELQKYRLLAYLQEVKGYFKESRLYPQLADLVYHYNNLHAFRANKRFLKDNFPKKLEGVNLKQMELVYEKMLADDEVMRELEDIIEYSVEQMTTTIREGAEIYEQVEQHVKIGTVGIQPLYKREGFVFCCAGNKSEVWIYDYTITLFEHKDAKYKGIRMSFIEQTKVPVICTLEQLKIDVIRRFRSLPNPAVFLVDYPSSIPLDETLLPIAKRLLVKVIEGENMLPAVIH